AFALGATAGGTVSVDGAMIAGHALAAVVTAVAVCHGERMLRAVARGIHSLLRVAVVAPPTGGWPAPALPLTTPRGLRPRLALADLSRRGPPR
ncbi:hypothetical protein NH287_14215, partial [Microbacterium sp. CnD16-F]|nr:hypothetical protein [Microbacterium sp. CnD16-F]